MSGLTRLPKLLLVAAANTINATLYDNINYTFIRDIAPVAGILRTFYVMEVNPSVPAKTVPLSSSDPPPPVSHEIPRLEDHGHSIVNRPDEVIRRGDDHCAGFQPLAGLDILPFVPQPRDRYRLRIAPREIVRLFARREWCF